jgi:hypothetical protein
VVVRDPWKVAGRNIWEDWPDPSEASVIRSIYRYIRQRIHFVSSVTGLESTQKTS